MSQNLLKNGGFEADWGDEKSHRCLIFPKSGPPQEKEIGNIFTPPGWITWFRHDPGTWDQPEVRDAWKEHDPRRVHGGEKGILLFTFFRKHDAGFLQQVRVTPGQKLRLTAWAHAWSNHAIEGHEDCADDGRCSCGVGREAAFILEGEAPELGQDSWNDAIPNFTFYVGVDPTGGTNPFAGTVVWGRGAHIYNKHAQTPPVEATAQSDTVTVFLRSKTMWGFKHNDAYWDDAKLIVVGEDDHEVPPPQVQLSHSPTNPKVGQAVTIQARSSAGLTDVRLEVSQPSGAKLALGPVLIGTAGELHTWTYTTSPVSEAGAHTITFSAPDGAKATGKFEVTPTAPEARGQPREQYSRTYVLLPPDADAAWALAVVDGSWKQHRYTIGGSADDSGIGDLNVRRVIAVNPKKWPTNLRAFFEEYYPGVEYSPIQAESPEELKQKLENL